MIKPKNNPLTRWWYVGRVVYTDSSTPLEAEFESRKTALRWLENQAKIAREDDVRVSVYEITQHYVYKDGKTHNNTTAVYL